LTILLDIETSPHMAYIWNVWKQNIQHEMMINRGYIMCATVKVLGDNQCFYYETRDENDYEVVKALMEWLSLADIVIAHNAKKFDIPLIRARAIVHGMKPPSPYKVIDTLEIAKREFKFVRNTLKNLAEELHCTPKDSHDKFPGFSLWSECIKGNDEAWEEMKLYNTEDVLTLEEVYLKLRPWDTQHPNVLNQDGTVDDGKKRCPKCGSYHLQRRGYYYSNTGQYQRLQCQDCGGWSSTRYTENSIKIRKSLLKSR